ncbi:hypothetical protein I5Q34_14230 [Streptomyces sp. AV19]|uniref:hypothetical protein n=1 Tax=Streptomyces sp. AV19 TaxID=2793068 RepID=UPI0018FE2687|nr:hypothetical protein [Streptomyces sp. AV19]MBH1935416.1 hypothetical protein [Streptomyces sp. AV19]MDG4531303.1 hypothetical protein [Streptomyces sp. AV19]
MYGPGPEPGQPQPHRTNRAMVVTIRVIVVAITLCSLCILSWVPMLRTAIVRRRAQDWVLFWGTLIVSFGLLAWVGESPKDSVSSNVGVGALLLLGALTITAYLMADIRYHKEPGARRLPPAPAFVPSGYGYPPAPPAGACPPPHAQQPYGGATLPTPQPNPYMTPPGVTQPSAGAPAVAPPAMASPAPPHISTPQMAREPYEGSRAGTPQGPGEQLTRAAAHRSPERIRQVRAELDELSDLLRKEAGEQGERER